MMMSVQEHIERAEILLDTARRGTHVQGGPYHQALLLEAQVHASLAAVALEVAKS